MGTKGAMFSNFTVESLLSTDGNAGKRDHPRQKSRQDSKCRDNDSTQNHCAGRQDLNLDDYLDEDGSLKPGQAAHSKWRRNRTIFNSAQLKTLEETFHRQKYLSVGVRGKLARSLGLSEDQVKTWFQNRRTKFKKNVCIRPRPIVIPNVPAEILQNYPQHPYYKTADIPRYPTIPSDVHKRTERSRTIHSYPVPRPVLPPALPSSFSREKIWNQFCPPV